MTSFTHVTLQEVSPDDDDDNSARSSSDIGDNDGEGEGANTNGDTGADFEDNLKTYYCCPTTMT